MYNLYNSFLLLFLQLKQSQEIIKNPVLNTLVPQSVFHESSILRTSVGEGNWDSGHPLTILFASLETSGMYLIKVIEYLIIVIL